MRQIEVTLPKPHPAQVQIIQQARRMNCAALGRRSGKTVLGIRLMAKKALVQRLPCAWIAPSYKLLDEAWRETKLRLANVIITKQEQTKRIELMGGGALDFWTLEDEGAGRGRKYARMIIDEAAHARYLKDTWENALLPTLTDYRGDAFFLSTPLGRNYFHDLFQNGNPDNPERLPDWQSWQMPTTCNPYISTDEVENMRKLLPERVYQQEYCHLPSTLVAMADGTEKPIICLDIGDELVYNDALLGLKTCKVVNMKATGLKRIVSIQLENSMKLSASVGHKLKNQDGKVAIEDATHVVFTGPLVYPQTKEAALARLLGYNLGDGTVAKRTSKYVKKNGDVSVYGDYYQASFYSNDKRDLELLSADCVLSGLSEKKPTVLFKKGSKPEYDAYQLHLPPVASKALVDAGAVVGKKIMVKMRIPEWIIQGGDVVKTEFVAALWGAEGSTPTINQRVGKKSKICKMPVLSMMWDINHYDGKFLGDISQIMEDIGVSVTTLSSATAEKITNKIYVKSNPSNIHRFYSKIGYRYASTKETLAFYWQHYLGAYIYRVEDRQKEVVRMLSDGMSYDEVGESIGISGGGVRAIIKHKPTRTDWKFPHFQEWIDSRANGNTLSIEVAGKDESETEEHVYNITVDSPDHSYILASGIDNFNCAEFIQDGAGVFRGIDRAPSCDWQEQAQRGQNYVIGVDWGRHNDFTVFTVLNHLGQLVHLERFTDIGYELQVGRLKSLWQRFDRCPILAESNSMGGPLIERLQRENLNVRPFNTTNASKSEAIEALSLALENGQLAMPDDDRIAVLKSELLAYDQERLPSGQIRYGAPRNQHDDAVMSLAIAWHGKGTGRANVVPIRNAAVSTW